MAVEADEQHDPPDALPDFAVVDEQEALELFLADAVDVSVVHSAPDMEAFFADGVTVVFVSAEAVDVDAQQEEPFPLAVFFESPQPAYAVTAINDKDIAAIVRS